MSNKECYYKVLGLSKDMSQDDINKKGRKAMALAHPDRHGGSDAATKKFQLVNEAYQVLKDPTKRAAYDRGGFAGLEELENGGSSGPVRKTRGPTFSDEFGELFGKAGERPDAAPESSLFAKRRARRTGAAGARPPFPRR